MCGNFGLLIVKPSGPDIKANENPFAGGISKLHDPHSELNASIRRSIHEVGRNRGVRVAEERSEPAFPQTLSNNESIPVDSGVYVNNSARLMLPISILQNQTACTEARGGQAGGISYHDFCPSGQTEQSSVFDDQFSSLHDMDPLTTRVRMVANKRTPLAEELANLFSEKQSVSQGSGLVAFNSRTQLSHENSLAITALGHTRFATSSINIDSELHPHEWERFHREFVWKFNPIVGRMEKINSLVGVHITHNGDFDELSAYNSKMVNEEVGWWLERVLHCSNDASGDSPKIAGFMDLTRVQGRWGAAARLAYIRCICKNSVDEVTGDSSVPLSKLAPNAFPPGEYFDAWGHFFESMWIEHMNNIVKTISALNKEPAPSAACMDEFNVDSSVPKGSGASSQYRVDRKNMKQFCKALENSLRTTDYEAWKTSLSDTSVHRGGAHDFWGRSIFSAGEDNFDPDRMVKLSAHGSSRHGRQTSAHGSSRHGQTSAHGSSRHGQTSAHGSSRHGQEENAGPDNPFPVDEEVDTAKLLYFLDGSHWTRSELKSFVYAAVRGFLFADLYTALTEFLSRAQGSFGLQVHSTLEPGVLVVASKGQPMSLAFDPKYPIVLSGSEAEAVAVPVSSDGKQWCRYRLDLDAKGEIVRVGLPRALVEGSFCDIDDGIKKVKNWNEINNRLYLGTVNIELKSYLLSQNFESGAAQLLARTITIATSASVKSSLPAHKTGSMCASLLNCISPDVSNSSTTQTEEPPSDMVAEDLSKVPAVLAAVDRAWLSSDSVEFRAADSLSRDLCACMVKRSTSNVDTIDFLISGVEVSLWIAEQFAADMRLIFPQLNVSTISANKLLSYMPEGGNFSKVPYFPGTENIMARRVDRNTCILLISQSGQTFPTLHATRVLCTHSPSIDISKIWLLTGCFNSKMELVLKEAYAANKLKRHSSSRVFNNYAGNRPAEPSSVAVVASMHSLTRMLLHVTKYVRAKFPTGRLVPEWAQKGNYAVAHAAHTIWGYYKRHRDTFLGNKRKSKRFPSGSAPPAATSTLKETVLMTVSDGCITDMSSLLLTCLIPDMVGIVGYDILGLPAECIGDRSSGISEKSYHDKSLHSHHSKHGTVEAARVHVAKQSGRKQLFQELVYQGFRLSQYITEYYRVHFLVGCYIVLAVGFGLPFFGCLGSIVLAVFNVDRNYVLYFSPRTLHVLLHQPSMYSIVGLTLQLLDALLIIYCLRYVLVLFRISTDIPVFARFGKRTVVIVDTPCIHQLLEAFVSKLFSQSFGFNAIDVHGASSLDHFVHKYTHRVTRGVLVAVGRCDGRLCCLAKSEASSLLACKQAAFIQNPLFVSPSSPKVPLSHRAFLRCVEFARGVHAMFRREPKLNAVHTDSTLGIGHGPEFITIGHNPFIPNLGDSATHIVLPSNTRRKFVDEYLYERLFLAVKPFPGAILRRLSADFQLQKHDGGGTTRDKSALTSNPLVSASDGGVSASDGGVSASDGGVSASDGGANPLVSASDGGVSASDGGVSASDGGVSASDGGANPLVSASDGGVSASDGGASTTYEPALSESIILPYGTHFINPLLGQGGLLFPDFIMNFRDVLSRKHTGKNAGGCGGSGNVKGGTEMVVKPFSRKSYGGKVDASSAANTTVEKQIAMSNNPGVRVAFTHKLDSDTQSIQDSQFVLQCFYENRIAAIERYVAFCKMFHSMAHNACLVTSYYPWWLNWLYHALFTGRAISIERAKKEVLWDITRSQSNLRIATTACPMSAPTSCASSQSVECKAIIRQFVNKLHDCEYFF